jgi:putative membrane protein
MHWWGYGWGMGWMMLWLLVPVVLLLLLVRALVGNPRTAVREGESPELILKRRYAKGEIDREEYERRLNDVRK